VVYGSSRGSTRRIVSRLGEAFHFPFDTFDVRDVPDPAALLAYDFLVFFCPTYGDDEVQDDVEAFLQRPGLRLDGRPFAICAPGSYDGYGFFSPAAGRILRAELLDRGGVEAVPLLALDAMPVVDRPRLDEWCRLVDAWVAGRPAAGAA
jgi:flavodoxin